MQIHCYDGPMSAYDQLAYELLLISRYGVQNLPTYGRDTMMDRSAVILLARLDATGPMSVADLAEAFGLNTSTVHRQLKAAVRNGLIELIDDPTGAPAKLHRPTEEGRRQLHQELHDRSAGHAAITADWEEAEVAELTRLLRRFNREIEKSRDQYWPRPE